MNLIKPIVILFALIMFSSCVSKKTYLSATESLAEKEVLIKRYKTEIGDCNQKLTTRSNTIASLNAMVEKSQTEMKLKGDQVDDLKSQITDLKKMRDQQMTQVGDLTVLSKKASDNIGETIRQMEKKDKYINLLQQAKTKADSLNFALALNLKSVLKDGIEDKDIDVKVDKTVVFINLSDKMLYQSGSATLTPQASEVLAKIAQIVKSRPELDVMVEGYTDSNPINTSCIQDNWDLSVKRSTAVIRVLQSQYGVNPDKLIAAGRGQYNALASNDTVDGKSMNRRTRIILLPRLNQFYDLLEPGKL